MHPALRFTYVPMLSIGGIVGHSLDRIPSASAHARSN